MADETTRGLRMLASFLLVAFALSMPGHAQAGKAEAKKYFRKAEKLYKLGKFEKALEHYSKAYDEWDRPAFLFNIGQCHMELKNYEMATFFFEGYLREKPNAPDAGMVENRLALAQQAAQKETAVAAAIRKVEEEKRRLEQEKQLDRERLERERLAEKKRNQDEESRVRRKEEAAALAAVTAKPVKTETPPAVAMLEKPATAEPAITHTEDTSFFRTPGIAPIVLWAGGGAGLLAGIVFGTKANGHYKNATDPKFIGGQHEVSAGETSDLIANIGFAVGGAAAATGVILWLFFPEEEQPAVAVGPGPIPAGISVGIDF